MPEISETTLWIGFLVFLDLSFDWSVVQDLLLTLDK